MMKEARRFPRQVQALVGEADRVLAIEVENLVTIGDGLVLLHLRHLLLRAAKQEDAVVIREKELGTMRADGRRVRPTDRLHHSALELALAEDGAGHPGGGGDQHRGFGFVEGHRLLVGLVAEWTVLQFHAEAETARAPADNRLEQREIPRLLDLRKNTVPELFDLVHSPPTGSELRSVSRKISE